MNLKVAFLFSKFKKLFSTFLKDSVGGLHIRPPIQNEWRPRNWLDVERSHDFHQTDSNWHAVPPLSADKLICFPGDMMQYATNGLLLATPHKVLLMDTDRYSIVYFHEPNFNAVIRPFPLVCKQFWS